MAGWYDTKFVSREVEAGSGAEHVTAGKVVVMACYAMPGLAQQ